MQRVLSTLTSLQIRGGYYEGHEVGATSKLFIPCWLLAAKYLNHDAGLLLDGCEDDRWLVEWC